MLNKKIIVILAMILIIVGILTSTIISGTNKQKVAKLQENKQNIKEQIIKGDTSVVKLITKENVDTSVVQSLSNIDNKVVNFDLVEGLIADAVYSHLSFEDKNIELEKMIKENKYGLVASLIRSGADYSKSETMLSKYAIEQKNDKLLAALVDKGFKFANNVTVNGVIDNLLYYTLNNDMLESSKSLVTQNFDIKSTYKPTINGGEEFPLVFAAAKDSKTFPLVRQMIIKDNVVKALNNQQKQQFLAYFLYNFSQEINKQDLDVLKYVLTQDVNINSSLHYNPYETAKYITKDYPVWTTPLYIANSNAKYDTLSVTNTLNSYINEVTPKITGYNFNQERFTSIGLATHLKLNQLVTNMLANGLKPSSLDSDNNQEPILIIALRQGNFELAKILIDFNLDLNVELNNKSSYLLSYLEDNRSQDKLKGVKLLVEKGANVNQCVDDSNGGKKCPLAVAIKENSKSEVTSYLQSKGAK
jgi:hypothetical protein